MLGLQLRVTAVVVVVALAIFLTTVFEELCLLQQMCYDDRGRLQLLRISAVADRRSSRAAL